LGDVFAIQPITRSAWPTHDLLTSEGADLLRDVGIPMLVVPYERYLGYAGNVGGFTDTSLLLNGRLGDGSTIRMLIVDEITQLLDPDQGDSPGTGSPAERAIRLMASAAAMRYQLDPDLRSMVLTTPDLTAPDTEVLSHIEGFVAEHPDFSFQPLDRIADITNSFFVEDIPVTVDLDARPSMSLVERVEQIDETRAGMADVGSMLPADDARRAAWDASMQVALSTGLTAQQSNRRIGEVIADLDEIRQAVQEPEIFSFTITGRHADIPVRIENTSDTPLRVKIRLEAEKLNFPTDLVDAVLLPNSVTAISVPVTSRSNGVFPVVIEVLTPAGTALTEPVELSARVSTLAGLGRVFTVGALLVLASWWFSYFRRRRRSGRQEQIETARSRHPAKSEEDGKEGEVVSDGE
jgi:hypothetical protein